MLYTKQGAILLYTAIKIYYHKFSQNLDLEVRIMFLQGEATANKGQKNL